MTKERQCISLRSWPNFLWILTYTNRKNFTNIFLEIPVPEGYDTLFWSLGFADNCRYGQPLRAVNDRTGMSCHGACGETTQSIKCLVHKPEDLTSVTRPKCGF